MAYAPYPWPAPKEQPKSNILSDVIEKITNTYPDYIKFPTEADLKQPWIRQQHTIYTQRMLEIQAYAAFIMQAEADKSDTGKIFTVTNTADAKKNVNKFQKSERSEIDHLTDEYGIPVNCCKQSSFTPIYTSECGEAAASPEVVKPSLPIKKSEQDHDYKNSSRYDYADISARIGDIAAGMIIGEVLLNQHDTDDRKRYSLDSFSDTSSSSSDDIDSWKTTSSIIESVTDSSSFSDSWSSSDSFSDTSSSSDF